jgi:hypothetical protein
MPTSRIETAIAAVETALGTVSAIVGLTVERARDHAVTPGEAPILMVYADGDRTERERVVGLGIWSAPVRVEGVVKASTIAGLGPALNDLYGRALEALEADRTLGGAAVRFRETNLSTAVDRERGHRPMMTFDLALEVDVDAAEGDPFSAP